MAMKKFQFPLTSTKDSSVAPIEYSNMSKTVPFQIVLAHLSDSIVEIRIKLVNNTLILNNLYKMHKKVRESKKNSAKQTELDTLL